MNKSKLKTNERSLNEIKEKFPSNTSLLKDKNDISFTKREKSLKEIDILYKEHVNKINNKYKRCAKLHPNKNYEYSKHIDLKRCEICTDFINDKYMLLCDICDDGYHLYCLV